MLLCDLRSSDRPNRSGLGSGSAELEGSVRFSGKVLESAAHRAPRVKLRARAALGKKITSASASDARKNRGALVVSGALQTSENNLQKYLKKLGFR